MEQTDKAVASTIEQMSGYASQFMGKLETLAATYGDQVVDTALAVARVDAASELMSFVIPATITTVTAWQSAKSIRKVLHPDDEKWPKGSDREIMQAFHGVKAGLCGFVSALAFIPACIQFSIWPFVGLIVPELWIVAKALNLN